MYYIVSISISESRHLGKIGIKMIAFQCHVVMKEDCLRSRGVFSNWMQA